MGTTKKKRRKQQNNLLVLRLLVLVVLALVIFEGKLVYTMFTYRPGSSLPAASSAKNGSSDTIQKTEDLAKTDKNAAQDDAPAPEGSVTDTPLAGLSAAISRENTKETAETEDPNKISEVIDSPAVVKESADPVDDSYFSNAVFIGDSRMEGFRNSSGITQGTFLTSVGLSTDGMSNPTIATAEGNISVYQGLSGRQYDKIYLMLGTNDLGYYPWETFPVNFENVITQFHKLQPDATIYICNVIYVEGAKIATDYVNNDNVRKINGYLLEVCEKLDYAYYLNLNEIFTNGYGSLLDGASSDGVHLYEKYCAQMLDYLKSHYVDAPSSAQDASSAGETEGSSEEDTQQKDGTAQEDDTL